VERGYYLVSNVSYNIKQLVNSELVVQERSSHDRGSLRVTLTEKGEGLCRQIAEVEIKHADALGTQSGDSEQIESVCQLPRRLETNWSNYLLYGEH